MTLDQRLANVNASGIVSPIHRHTGMAEKPTADFSEYIYYTHPVAGAI